MNVSQIVCTAYVDMAHVTNEHELRKENKFNPDKKKSWKKYRRFKRNNKHKQHLKLDKKHLISDDYKKKKGVMREKYYPYRDPATKYKTLTYYQLIRHGIYCKKCDNKFCDHRIIETFVSIVMSHKKKHGYFSFLPKDIVLMIAKEIYNVQKQHLTYINDNVFSFWNPDLNPYNDGFLVKEMKKRK